jgi:hypothetical protein
MEHLKAQLCSHYVGRKATMGRYRPHTPGRRSNAAGLVNQEGGSAEPMITSSESGLD